MRLSAIIPTHDRPDLLRGCLETLHAQAIDPSDLEVIVVDDGSSKDIGSLVADVATRGPIAMRCERQHMGGLNRARNRGVQVAGGDVLAFLDDDTFVSPGWAPAMLAAFQSFDCAAVGGRVELGLTGPPPPWLDELAHYLARYDLGDEPRWLADDPVPVGANCAVRRSDFERMGGFVPGLDRIGTSLISNGDTEFFRRLRDAGGRMRYEPGAGVVHRVPADRLTRGFFVQRHRAQGTSDELLLRLDGHRASIGHRLGQATEVARAIGRVCSDLVHRRDPTVSYFLVHYWSARFSAAGGLRRRALTLGS